MIHFGAIRGFRSWYLGTSECEKADPSVVAKADKAFGGHLEPGTTVFRFPIVTVGVLKDGIDLSRVDDNTYR
jgi:hypothetical protein